MKNKYRHGERLTMFFIVLLVIVIVKVFQSDNPQQIHRPWKYCQREQPALIYVNLLYVPSLNILFCHVPKAASTNLRRFLHRYLHPQTNHFDSETRRDVWTTIENDFNPFYLHNDNRSREILRLKIPLKFLFVRHPLRRIYASFKDKFLHDHEEDALFGWKSMEEQILLQLYPNETELTLRRRDAKVNFRTFLLYLVDSIRKSLPMNSHWDLLVTRCGICHLNYDYFVQIENFESNTKFFSDYFQTSVTFPPMEKTRDDLSDEELIDLFRRTLNNSRDFQTLIDYYTPDFQAFHYSIPH